MTHFAAVRTIKGTEYLLKCVSARPKSNSGKAKLIENFTVTLQWNIIVTAMEKNESIATVELKCEDQSLK